MQLLFKVDEQIITFENHEKKVVAKSQNYLTCKFSFSEEWNNVTKTAIFISAKGNVYNQILNDDSCAVPWEVIEYPHFIVSIFGGDRITANSVSVTVTKSGYVLGETPKEPTPDVYQQILKMIEDIEVGGISEEKLKEIVNAEIEKVINSADFKEGLAEEVLKGISVPKKISDLIDDTLPVGGINYAEHSNFSEEAKVSGRAIKDVDENPIHETYAKKTDIPTHISNLIDDTGYHPVSYALNAKNAEKDFDGIDFGLKYATKKELSEAIGEALEGDY